MITDTIFCYTIIPHTDKYVYHNTISIYIFDIDIKSIDCYIFDSKLLRGITDA